jgi:hypothetical protein
MMHTRVHQEQTCTLPSTHPKRYLLLLLCVAAVQRDADTEKRKHLTRSPSPYLQRHLLLCVLLHQMTNGGGRAPSGILPDWLM